MLKKLMLFSALLTYSLAGMDCFASPQGEQTSECDKVLATLPVPFSLPSFAGFKIREKVSVETGGYLYTVEYIKPLRSWTEPKSLLGHLLNGLLGSYPFYSQFGYKWQELNDLPDDSSFQANHVIFRQPDAKAVNKIGDLLKRARNPHYPRFRFVPYDFAANELLVSKHYARNEIVVYEPNDGSAAATVNEELESLFFHDSNFHRPFWLVAGKHISGAISGNHQILQRLYELLKSESRDPLYLRKVHGTIQSLNDISETISGGFPLNKIDLSLAEAIQYATSTPDWMSESAYDKPGLSMLQQLYTLTRSPRSLLVRKENRYFLRYYKHGYSNIVLHETPIDDSLLPKSALAKIHALWEECQKIPELGLNDMEMVRLGIAATMHSRPTATIP